MVTEREARESQRSCHSRPGGGSVVGDWSQMTMPGLPQSGLRWSMSLLYLAPDELTPAAECAIVHRLLEDGDDPNAWTVAYVWAGDGAVPVYQVASEREDPAACSHR